MAKILLVDDNPGLLAMQAEYLHLVGHEVATASDGMEALRLVHADPLFDIVITDLVMPEKEGIETIIELRQKFPAIKVIAMSGGGRGDPTSYLRIARSLGAQLTLCKPFSGDELVGAVSKVMASAPTPGSKV
jgi:CheY-like chemotaxis protein